MGDALQIAGTIASDARIVRWDISKRLLIPELEFTTVTLGADIAIARLDNGEAA